MSWYHHASISGFCPLCLNKKKLLLSSNAPVIGCQSPRRPRQIEKEKEKEKKKRNVRSALQSEPASYKSKRAARTLIARKEKSLYPGRFFPCARPALLVLVLFSCPYSFVMNYYAHAHAVDDWLFRVVAIKSETM